MQKKSSLRARGRKEKMRSHLTRGKSVRIIGCKFYAAQRTRCWNIIMPAYGDGVLGTRT